MIKKVLSFSDWLNFGFTLPKNDSFAKWNKEGKELRKSRIAQICDICDISSTTVINIEKGTFYKDIYAEAIVSLAEMPLVFKHKENYFLVDLD